jgi:hypothetical protein
MLKSFEQTNPQNLVRQTRQATSSIAANAGATAVLGINVAINTLVFIKALIKLAAGSLSRFSVTADAGTDVLTAASAHGLATGTPVFVSGTGQPGGVTATTIYYVNAASATTLKLYDTKANAVTGSGTGLVDITSAGSGVIVQATVEQGFYEVTAVCRNRNGKVELLGSADVIAMEDVAAWVATAVADDTNDKVNITITPDPTLATRYDVYVEYFEDSINA